MEALLIHLFLCLKSFSLIRYLINIKISIYIFIRIRSFLNIDEYILEHVEHYFSLIKKYF